MNNSDLSAICRAHSLWVDYELYPSEQLRIVERTLHICNFCLRREVFVPRLQTCSKCKAIRYCNSECQTKDWLEHKTTCAQPEKEQDKEQDAKVLDSFLSLSNDKKTRKEVKEELQKKRARLSEGIL